jgi:hypothetical protein
MAQLQNLLVLTALLLGLPPSASPQLHQQGTKLVGSGPGKVQGAAVALSADGNTALVGAPVPQSQTSSKGRSVLSLSHPNRGTPN